MPQDRRARRRVRQVRSRRRWENAAVPSRPVSVGAFIERQTGGKIKKSGRREEGNKTTAPERPRGGEAAAARPRRPAVQRRKSKGQI